MGLRSRRIFAIGILLAAGARADNADRPDVHVGDRWSWQHTNGLANERDYTTIEDVIDVSSTEIKTRWRIKGKPNSSIAAFTLEWNPVDVVSARYEVLLREFAFPLQVGKKWDASADKMLFSNGKHGKFTVTGRCIPTSAHPLPTATRERNIDSTGSDQQQKAQRSHHHGTS